MKAARLPAPRHRMGGRRAASGRPPRASSSRSRAAPPARASSGIRASAAAPAAASELPWTAVSGRGTLFSWAVVRRALVSAFAEQVPYVSALVALAEDPAVRVVTQLVDCAPEALRAEQPLRVVFRPLAVSGT